MCLHKQIWNDIVQRLTFALKQSKKREKKKDRTKLIQIVMTLFVYLVPYEKARVGTLYYVARQIHKQECRKRQPNKMKYEKY